MVKQILTFSLVLLLSVFGWFGPSTLLALTPEQQFFNEAWQVVNQAYVDDSFNHQDWRQVRQEALKQPLPNREATYAAIQVMLERLNDPFTRLLPPSQYDSLRASTAGQLTGVGLQISGNNETGYPEVIAPMEGSPAADAGLQPNDQILRIDHIPTDQLTLDEAAERMRGPIGTPVELTVKRGNLDGNSELLQVSLTRDRIAINPVFADLRQTESGLDFGYIRLRQFNANSSPEMVAAIQRLESEGAEAYILDVRNNPGGLLEAGIDIARLWLNPSPIVYTVDRLGHRNSFNATVAAFTDAPLVVLVNRGSASASEILAGALQDNDRAQLVGENTFGKGLIQSLFDLSDGSGLAVTIAKYETPNHRDINRVGISPDRVVAMVPLGIKQLATERDAQYLAAVDLLSPTPVLTGAA